MQVAAGYTAYYAVYLVVAALLTGVVVLALMAAVVVHSERLRTAAADLLAVAGLVAWCGIRAPRGH